MRLAPPRQRSGPSLSQVSAHLSSVWAGLRSDSNGSGGQGGCHRFGHVRGRTCNGPPAGYAMGFAGSQQQGSGAASHCCFCAGMMPENRDNGHAKISASSRLRGVDRHHAGPSAARWVAGARPAFREGRVPVATGRRCRSHLFPSKGPSGGHDRQAPRTAGCPAHDRAGPALRRVVPMQRSNGYSGNHGLCSGRE